MPRYRSHGSGGGSRRGLSREESLKDLTETASNAIGSRSTAQDRVSGAIVSNKVFSQPKQQQQQSRSMLTDQNRNGNLANTRLTFRHKPNYMSPAEKTKLASIERGDEVYERISKREEVPTWLETIAKAPAQESRKALFRHETAEEEELQPEYVPPHLDPIPSNIVDNSFWKQNPRRGHGLAEAQVKKRIVVPSSELPTMRDTHRPDQTPKGYKREAEEDADLNRNSKRHKRSKRYKTPSSSENDEDEEAAISRSFLQNESATIRDQPGIVAGGAAVIRSPGRARRHRPSPPQPMHPRESRRPMSLEHFRYQPAPIRATPLPSMSNPHPQMPVAHHVSPGFISPSFRAVPLVKPIPYRPPVPHRATASHAYPRVMQHAASPTHYPQVNQVFANKMAQAVPNFRPNDQGHQATAPPEVFSQHPQGGMTASMQLLPPSSESGPVMSGSYLQPINSVRPAPVPPLTMQTPSSPFSRVVYQAGVMAESSNQSLSRAVQAMAAGSQQQPSLHRAILQTAIPRSTANPMHPFIMINQQPQRMQYEVTAAPIGAVEVQNVRPSIEKHDTEYFESLLDDDFGELEEQKPKLDIAFSHNQAYPVLPRQSLLHEQGGQASPLLQNQYANDGNEHQSKAERSKAQRTAPAQMTPPGQSSKRTSQATSLHQSKLATPRISRQVTHSAAIAPMPLPGAASSKSGPKKRALPPSERRQTRSATLAASAQASSKKVRASSSSHKYSDSLEDGGRTNTPATSDAELTFGGKKFTFDPSKISFG